MTKKQQLKSDFIGTWKGTDNGSLNENEINYWQVVRTEDGKFFVDFITHFKDGTIEKSSEFGLWFADENFFYEQRNGEEQADVYTYTILPNRSIRFKDTVSSYQFLDELVLLN